MIIITVSMLSIHARSASYGLDQMTTRRSINRFFNSSLWKAPHHCMSLYTPSARTCFLGCGVRAKWIKYDMIARDWAIHTYTYAWANRGELYELIIRQDHLQYKTYRDVCRVWAICYSLSTHMIHVFRGWAMGYKWASSWSVWRVQNYDTDRDQRVALLSIWHWFC